MLLALMFCAVAGVFAGAWVALWMDPPLPDAPVFPVNPDASMAAEASEGDPLEAMLTLGDSVSAWHALPGDLKEPEGATRCYATDRAAGPWLERWWVWSYENLGTDEIMQRSLHAARQAGFHTDAGPFGSSTSPDALQHWMRRQGDLLQLRVRQRGGKVFLTWVLRYATMS